MTTQKTTSVPFSRKSIVKVCLVALFAAVIAAGAFAAIHIGPVPIVLQNILVLLSGLILGPVLGGTAAALYLLAGILGLPVFAGGIGGIARLAGPTGGFLAGYVLMAILAGLIAGRPRAGKNVSIVRIIIAVASGLLVVYIPGLVWLKITTGYEWPRALALFFLPYLPGDALKGMAAVLVAPRLRKTAADILDS